MVTEVLREASFHVGEMRSAHMEQVIGLPGLMKNSTKHRQGSGGNVFIHSLTHLQTPIESLLCAGRGSGVKDTAVNKSN